MFKFINSVTNKELGTSTVTIKYKNKYYTKTARLHPEDNWSEFTGCRIAETKAELAALKDEIKQKKMELSVVKKLIQQISQSSKFDKKNANAKLIYRQLNAKSKELDGLIDCYKKKNYNLKRSITTHSYVNKKINARKEDEGTTIN